MKKLKKFLAVFISIVMMLSITIPFIASANDSILGCEGRDCLLDGDTVTIHDEDIALSRGFDVVIETGSWALLNLILTAGGIAFAIMMAIKLFAKKNDEDDTARKNNDDDIRIVPSLAIPLLAIAGTVLFLLTQDMSLKMGITNFWTLPQAALFAAGMISYFFVTKKDDTAQFTSAAV